MGDGLVVGSSDGIVYALSADGHPLWLYDVGAPVHSRPTVVGGIVYLGAQDGLLRALDSGSGDLIWSADVGGQMGASSPVSDGNIVAIGNTDGAVRAFDALDGQLIWGFDSKGPKGPGGSTHLRLGDDLLFVGSPLWRIHALDLATGAPRWEARAAGPVEQPLLLGEQLVVTSLYGSVDTLDARTGELLGNIQFRDYLSAAPVSDGRLVVFETWRGRVLALDAARLTSA
jgi:outer membrane protein assembly factor BamB